MQTPITLAPYEPEWPRMTASRTERPRVPGPALVAVQHIGSTSVPGLAAKSIIDLIPVVTDLTNLDRQGRPRGGARLRLARRVRNPRTPLLRPRPPSRRCPCPYGRERCLDSPDRNQGASLVCQAEGACKNFRSLHLVPEDANE